VRSASKTLVKSPPEVWELVDQPERMQGLMSGLIGRAAEIEVSEREPGIRLAWESRDPFDRARIEVDISEKGWGTNVTVSAESPAEPTRLDGWLEAVMEELATPQKRPFGGMV